MSHSISTELIRGHTDTIILNILRQGDSYGYEISKRVTEISQGKYELKEATLYTTFRRLEKEGHIRSYWGDESQGGRRKYYSITRSGEATYTKNMADWHFAVEILSQLMRGEISNGQN